MKWSKAVAWWSAVIALAPAVAQAKAGGAPPALVAGSNTFACELYARLAHEPGNVFVSPFSVHGAMAMVYAGARGATATAMARTLHVTATPAALGASYGGLVRALRDTTRAPGARLASELNVANALWPSTTWNLVPAYAQGIERDYGGAVRPLDFAHDAAANATINAWVAGQTHGRIRDLIPDGALTPRTASVLVNAIYFRGDWMEPFPKHLTTPEPFHRGTAGDVQVPMMSRGGHIRYAEPPGAQLVSLPYADARLSMVVLLPRRAGGLAALERALAPASLARWLAQSKERLVTLRLPRFTFTRATRMDQTLAAMGMGAAFDPARADFTGMTPHRPAAISAVFHKAFIAVDETGTEAAAATGAVMEVTMARPMEPPVEFHADHPFVFLIRDDRTGAILFIGRVADPS